MAKSKIIILMSLLIAVLSWYFCLFTPYNYFTAKHDIRGGKINVISFGKVVPNEPEIDSLNEKYGFISKNIGCVVSGDEIRGISFYNHVVNRFLAKRNGENWNEKYLMELSALQKD